MTYLNTPQAGVPTTPIGPIARRWAPLIAFVVSLLVLVAIGALASWRPAAQAGASQPIIIVATPTMTGPAVAARPAPRAILARFDYARPETAAALTSADIVQIVGVADTWRLCETTAGARVWILVGDLPAGTPAIDPLPNLAMPTAAPAPIIVSIEAPAERAPDVPTAEPPPLYTGETLEMYFERTGITPVVAPAPTVDHAACCEKPAEQAAERRRQFHAQATIEGE